MGSWKSMYIRNMHNFCLIIFIIMAKGVVLILLFLGVCGGGGGGGGGFYEQPLELHKTCRTSLHAFFIFKKWSYCRVDIRDLEPF